jgi:predicted DNA-binding protein with PD1-like motif
MLVLEPGEEVLATVTRWAEREGVTSATVDMFFGALRSARLIATNGEMADPEPPLPDQVELAYLEGVGAGSIGTVDGRTVVHLHLAAGAKGEAGAAYAGHLLAAETHYTLEMVVQEVLDPVFRLEPDAVFGINCLHFGKAPTAS